MPDETRSLFLEITFQRHRRLFDVSARSGKPVEVSALETADVRLFGSQWLGKVRFTASQDGVLVTSEGCAEVRVGGRLLRGSQRLRSRQEVELGTHKILAAVFRHRPPCYSTAAHDPTRCAHVTSPESLARVVARDVVAQHWLSRLRALSSEMRRLSATWSWLRQRHAP